MRAKILEINETPYKEFTFVEHIRYKYLIFKFQSLLPIYEY